MGHWRIRTLLQAAVFTIKISSAGAIHAYITLATLIISFVLTTAFLRRILAAFAGGYAIFFEITALAIRLIVDRSQGAFSYLTEIGVRRTNTRTVTANFGEAFAFSSRIFNASKRIFYLTASSADDCNTTLQELITLHIGGQSCRSICAICLSAVVGSCVPKTFVSS